MVGYSMNTNLIMDILEYNHIYDCRPLRHISNISMIARGIVALFALGATAPSIIEVSLLNKRERKTSRVRAL